MTNRYFTKAQKEALYIHADGKCQQCGRPLPEGWHADHIKPYSRGGITDVTNGQATCDECNLKKGDSYLEWNLRNWQAAAFDKWRGHVGRFFMVTAVPGAGKTICAARCIYDALFESKTAANIIIVVNSTNLRKQWSASLTSYGIDIDYEYQNSLWKIADDYHGMVITYQQLTSAPDIYRKLCSDKKSLVVLDEIHHLGDQASWGTSAEHAFEHAQKIIGLSGTPFRSDGGRIPFVTYNDGVLYSDAIYDYSTALGDIDIEAGSGVVRDVFFPVFGGTVEYAEHNWLNDEVDYEIARLDQYVPEDEASRALGLMLDPKGEWMQEIMRKADDTLRQIRKTHHDAGGMILARDMKHAYALAEQMRKMTGEPIACVTSDDLNAHEIINAFRFGSQRWIVAVQMISEGTDIPRLRVAIHATPVKQLLSLWQYLGRIIRWVEGIKPQPAYYYIPNHPTIRQWADFIRDKIEASAPDIEDYASERATIDDNLRIEVDRFVREYIVEHVGTVKDGTLIEGFYLEKARQHRAEHIELLGTPVELIALVIRTLYPETAVAKEVQRFTKTKTERKKERRRRGGPISNLVKRLVESEGLEYQSIHMIANEAVAKQYGLSRLTQSDMTEEQLDLKEQVLREWANGTRPRV